MSYFVLCKTDDNETVIARQRPFATLYDAAKYMSTLSQSREAVVVRAVPPAVAAWVLRKGKK